MIKVAFEFSTPEDAVAAIQTLFAPSARSVAPTPGTVIPVAVSAPAAPAPVPVPVPVAPPPAVPVTAAPAYSRDQIMTAGATLIDAGKMGALQTLLNTFGVQAVTQLKDDQLGAFATELRKLGAQI